MRHLYEQISSVLNQKLFNGTELKPEIKEKALDVAAFFSHMAGIEPEMVEDIVLTGSNLGFSYGPESDLDIHIVLDKNKIGCDEAMIDAYFRAQKKVFDTTHDIKFYGIPVEVYVEDVDDKFPSGSGRYSLFEDEWLSEPTKDLPDENDKDIQMKVRGISMKVEDLIDDRVDVSVMKAVKERLRMKRSDGLSRSGMGSEENLIFKLLRNNGVFKQMDDYIIHRQDREFSLY